MSVKDEGPKQKVPYPFIALPKSICTTEYYRSPNMFIFLTWIFSRISFCKKSFPMNSKIISLDLGEFIFGRHSCSKETCLSEQSIRTMISSLALQGILKKITTKSTSKFTVYKIVWDHFIDSSNQQSNFQPTSNQPAINHKQEAEYKKESRQAAAIVKENAQFDLLSPEEQKAILALYNIRSSKKPISNPFGWIADCIKGGWHKSSMPIELACSDVEENRVLAKQIQIKLEKISTLKVFARKDFLELRSEGGKSAQMFYYETKKNFSDQILVAMHQFQIDPEQIL